MRWSFLLVALDDSAAGLNAFEVARHLGRSAGARISAVTVLSDREQPAPVALDAMKPAVRTGVPGIEILRAAENLGADLIIAGRCTQGGPDHLGPTADLLSRRSRLPCLFIPGPQQVIRRLVVALDGKQRGLGVLRAASQLQALLRVELVPVTVEPDLVGVGAKQIPPSARTERLREQLLQPVGPMPAPVSLTILHGEPAGKILEMLKEDDVIAVGVHRGSPAGPPDSSGVGRVLAHTAPCAVFTVPL